MAGGAEVVNGPLSFGFAKGEGPGNGRDKDKTNECSYSEAGQKLQQSCFYAGGHKGGAGHQSQGPHSGCKAESESKQTATNTAGIVAESEVGYLLADKIEAEGGDDCKHGSVDKIA